jgi:hypothetical protein
MFSLLHGGARASALVVLIAMTAIAYGAQRWFDLPTGLRGVYLAPNGSSRAIDQLPSTATLKERRPGFAQQSFTATWHGFVAAPRIGSYAIRIVADGPAAVHVDGDSVARTNGSGGSDGESRVVLQPGSHPIVIDYAHRGGEVELELWWSTPGGRMELLPESALLRSRASHVQLVAREVAHVCWQAVVVVWYVLCASLVMTALSAGVFRIFPVLNELLPAALIAVLALAFALDIWGIWWAMPNARGWGPDEVVPADVLAGLQTAFSHGWHDKYPPFHYFVLSVADSPVLVLNWLGVLDISDASTYGTLVVFGRLTSLLFALATLAVVYCCGRQLYGRVGAVFAALTMALTVPFAYYAKLANLDAPFMFWFATSLFAYIRIFQRHATRDYVLFAASATLAGCTKDQIWGAYVLAPIPILVARWKVWRQTGGSLVHVFFDRQIVLAVATGIGFFLVADNVIFNPSGFVAHVKLLLGTPHEFQVFPRTLSGELLLAWRSIQEMQLMFGWPLGIVAAVALLRGIAGNTTTPSLRWLLIPALSYYVAFVGVILFYFDRYFFPLTIVLSLFAGWWLERFIRVSVPFRRVRLAVVGGVFAYSVAYAGAVDYAMTHDSRYEVTRWLQAHSGPADVIGSLGPLEYFAVADNLRSVSVDSADRVGEVQPRYIVLNSDQIPSWSPDVRAMREALVDGRAGYELALRVRSAPLPLPERHPDLGPSPRHGPEVSDLSMINPTMEIFRLLPRRTAPSRLPQTP